MFSLQRALSCVLDQRGALIATVVDLARAADRSSRRGSRAGGAGDGGGDGVACFSRRDRGAIGCSRQGTPARRPGAVAPFLVRVPQAGAFGSYLSARRAQPLGS